jgi:nucleoside-diphosphate-sugar epimerase
MISINGLVDLVADIAGKRITKRHIDGPQGVRGRTSDNRLIREELKWAPSRRLRDGLEKTYAWIADQVSQAAAGLERAA